MCRYLIDLRLRPRGTYAYRYAYDRIRDFAAGDEVAMWVDENPRFLIMQLQTMLDATLSCHIERRRESLWHLSLRISGVTPGLRAMVRSERP